MRRRYWLSAAWIFASSVATAQVGYPPGQSPFRDLRERQAFTFYSGYYRAKLDPARVAPQSGPMVGVHYMWRASGPANLTLDAGRIASERRVLDPEAAGGCSIADESCKSAGVFRWPLYTLDAGLAMALTGERSWFRLVPEVKAGLGVVTDFHTKADVGEFAFGTRFAFSWGAGLRMTPGGRFQLRADITNRMYSVKYPLSYYVPAPDGTSIFGSSQNRVAWLNNPAFTVGLSYLFSR
jgi:hypothetical protein